MRARNKLTALDVENKNEVGRYSDGGGLYLQVSQIGEHTTKAWLFRYQIGGHPRAMGLGSVEDFTLAEARKRARAARQLVRDKIDPIEQRRARIDAERAKSLAILTPRRGIFASNSDPL